MTYNVPRVLNKLTNSEKKAVEKIAANMVVSYLDRHILDRIVNMLASMSKVISLRESSLELALLKLTRIL